MDVVDLKVAEASERDHLKGGGLVVKLTYISVFAQRKSAFSTNCTSLLEIF